MLALRAGFALPLACPSVATAATAKSSISDVYPTNAAPRVRASKRRAAAIARGIS